MFLDENERTKFTETLLKSIHLFPNAYAHHDDLSYLIQKVRSDQLNQFIFEKDVFTNLHHNLLDKHSFK